MPLLLGEDELGLLPSGLEDDADFLLTSDFSVTGWGGASGVSSVSGTSFFGPLRFLGLAYSFDIIVPVWFPQRRLRHHQDVFRLSWKHGAAFLSLWTIQKASLLLSMKIVLLLFLCLLEDIGV